MGSTRLRPNQATTLFQEYSHPLLLLNCAICVPCHTACRQLVLTEINFFFPSWQINLPFLRAPEEGLQSNVGCLPIMQFPTHPKIPYKSFLTGGIPIFSTWNLTQQDTKQPKLYLRQLQGLGVLPCHFSTVVFWMSNQLPLIGICGSLRKKKRSRCLFSKHVFLPC